MSGLQPRNGPPIQTCHYRTLIGSHTLPVKRSHRSTCCSNDRKCLTSPLALADFGYNRHSGLVCACVCLVKPAKWRYAPSQKPVDVVVRPLHGRACVPPSDRSLLGARAGAGVRTILTLRGRAPPPFRRHGERERARGARGGAGAERERRQRHVCTTRRRSVVNNVETTTCSSI